VETIASVVLGLAMLAAGAAKLASRTWTVPLVPWVELSLGALLVVDVLRPLVAIATAVLLAAFTALLSVRLTRGERPPCACFGRLSTRPISWWSVARNLVLIALAVAIAVSSA